MLTLVIRQSLPNGIKKVWKLRPDDKPKTFGSSRLADVISIDPLSKGIQGTFLHRNNQWYYIDLDRAHIESDDVPETLIKDSMSLKLDGSVLQLEIVDKDIKIFANPEDFTTTPSKDEKPTLAYTLYVVKMGDTVLESKVLPRGEKFTPTITVHESAKIISKDIDLKDVGDLMKVNKDQIFDRDGKRGAIVMLTSAFLLLGLGIFTPKKELAVEIPKPPVATKVVVMTELAKKKRGIETPKKQETKPAPTVAQNQPQNTPPKGGKGSTNMLKSFSAGRISQMLGKVSAQAAKTENVIVSVSGVKAEPERGGRALAALGPISKPGKDWSKDAKGNAGGVSTAGKAGGGSAAAWGSLSSGNTGNAGVGLIEDESEVVGGLDRDIIAQYIKTQLGQILYCYERQLSANPDIEGKVSVKFTIGPSGKVEMQSIGDTTLRNATVEGCILNRVAQWKFPAPQGGTKVVVTYPFLFKSTN